METVTMLEFRRNAASFLRRITKGERFLLSHRGKPAARLEPVTSRSGQVVRDDPFMTIGARAIESPKGKTKHADIDQILYGQR